jgi:hypothetical protein
MGQSDKATETQRCSPSRLLSFQVAGYPPPVPPPASATAAAGPRCRRGIGSDLDAARSRTGPFAGGMDPGRCCSGAENGEAAAAASPGPRWALAAVGRASSDSALLAAPAAGPGMVQTPWGIRVQRSGGEKPGAAAAAGGCFVLVFHCTM